MCNLFLRCCTCLIFHFQLDSFSNEGLLQVQIIVDSWDLPALSGTGFHCCVLSLSVSSQHAFNSRAPSNSMELLSAFRWRSGLSLSLARVWLDLLSLKAKPMMSLFPTQAAGWWSVTSAPSLFPLLWSMNAALFYLLFFCCCFLAEQVINKFVALAPCAGRFKRW